MINIAAKDTSIVLFDTLLWRSTSLSLITSFQALRDISLSLFHTGASLESSLRILALGQIHTKSNYHTSIHTIKSSCAVLWQRCINNKTQTQRVWIFYFTSRYLRIKDLKKLSQLSYLRVAYLYKISWVNSPRTHYKLKYNIGKCTNNSKTTEN